MAISSDDFSDVILTGGTGRSGTTIIGKLLSRHSRVMLARPAEIKMHVAGNGILDLYLGKRVGRYKRLMLTKGLHLKRFEYRLFHHWWERRSKVGELGGLVQGIDLEELNSMLNLLQSQWKQDHRLATRNFMRGFIDYQKKESGKAMWVDTTPINLFRSLELSTFLPGVRFIHMVRDGRDVIASVLRENWGPETYEAGLIWYRRRMKRILTNTTFLGSSVLTVSLEDLTANNRTTSLERVLSFLNLANEDKIKSYFDSEVKAELVRKGKWQSEVRDVAKFNRDYFKIVEELKAIDPFVPLGSS